MPRQHTLPHTADTAGPCDRERDAWLDAKEAASEANDDKRRKLQNLLDKMLETGTDRLCITDPGTKKRRWLVVTAETKLRAEKADPAPEGELSRPSRVPGKATGLAQDDAAGETASDGRAGDSNEPEAAGEPVEVDRFGQPVDGSELNDGYPQLSVTEAGKAKRLARRGAR